MGSSGPRELLAIKKSKFQRPATLCEPLNVQEMKQKKIYFWKRPVQEARKRKASQISPKTEKHKAPCEATIPRQAAMESDTDRSTLKYDSEGVDLAVASKQKKNIRK